MEKVLLSSDYGSVSVKEEAGVVSLSASVSVAAGGGQAAGVASVSGNVSINLQAKQLIDLGLDLAAAKFPSVAVAIEAVKAGVDAELAKA